MLACENCAPVPVAKLRWLLLARQLLRPTFGTDGKTMIEGVEAVEG